MTARLSTGVRNLDALLNGGLPKGSLTVLAGPPGAGKTILAQQICFSAAAAGHKILYLHTLSEPTAKTLLYLSAFSYFDAKQLDSQFTFVDLGVILRTKALDGIVPLIMDHVHRVQPSFVVVDSFKVFDDLASSSETLRKFSYEIAVNLMAWECTTLLLGEYAPRHYDSNPLFSIADGLVAVTQRESSGEQQRFLQIIKMRGTDHSRDECPFVITKNGVNVFAPRMTIKRDPLADEDAVARSKTGIARLDDLLGEGIPRGSTVLVGGAAGTGKTVLLLEFLYRGATLFGEKGIIFSFEETEERLRATARNLGWDFDREIAAGRIKIVFIPQPNISVEQHLLMIREHVEAMGARRIAIDSVSVFLHKVVDPQLTREKIFQLASIVQNARAVGLFATDIQYGSQDISRSSVEETVVDGVILLSSREEGLDRNRYLEVYKLRNTAHLRGRHSMLIGPGGLKIFPRYTVRPIEAAPPPIDLTRRLSLGEPTLDRLLGGGVLRRSATMVSGSAGTGKSTLGVQFLLAGVARDEPGLYIALEEAPAQIVASADALGLPLRAAVTSGAVELLYVHRDNIRDVQLQSVLTDRIEARGVCRLVLDGVRQVGDWGGENVLSQILTDLVHLFKKLGVTSILTLESKSLYSMDTLADGGLSPVADNFVMLRYSDAEGVLENRLVVVKTRGSAHDGGKYAVFIDKAGLHIGERV